MINNEYSIAISEVLDILNHIEKEYVDKISSEFMECLHKNASKEYISNLDHTKTIKDMNLGIKTKTILAIIYEKYWCTPEEKKVFINHLIENEKEYQKKLRETYDPDNLFKNIKSDISKNNLENENDNKALVEFKGKKILQIIFDAVKNFFRK